MCAMHEPKAVKTAVEGKRRRITTVLPLKRHINLHPYQCACSLVKAGQVSECPVHWLAIKLPEGRH